MKTYSYYSIAQMYNYLNMRIQSIDSALDQLNSNVPDYILAPIDVAKLIGTSRSTVYRLIKEKKLKGYQINNLWKIRLSYVDEYIGNYILPSMSKIVYPILIKKRGHI